MALSELAELLRELEQTLLRLKVTKDPERRRLLVRKMSRLFAGIERNPYHAAMSGPTPDKGLHGTWPKPSSPSEWKMRQTSPYVNKKPTHA